MFLPAQSLRRNLFDFSSFLTSPYFTYLPDKCFKIFVLSALRLNYNCNKVHIFKTYSVISLDMCVGGKSISK